MDDNKEFNTVIIPSTIQEIGRAIKEVKAYMEGKGYGAVKYRCFVDAVYEAVSNAVIHGNEVNEAKTVSITCVNEADKLHVRVADEGDGFNFSSIPDPRAPHNLSRPNGRGILIIKNSVDEFSFNEKGNEITLTIRK